MSPSRAEEERRHNLNRIIPSLGSEPFHLAPGRVVKNGRYAQVVRPCRRPARSQGPRPALRLVAAEKCRGFIFLLGRLTRSPFCVLLLLQAARTVQVSASAAERPVWFPGNPAPAHLTGKLAGDYGFDPLRLGEEPETLKW